MNTDALVYTIVVVFVITMIVVCITWGTIVSVEKTAQFQQTCFAQGGNPVRINGANVCFPVPVAD